MADIDDKKQARLQQEAEMDEVFKSEQTTIVPVDLDGEMKKSFIDYAMSVISDRGHALTRSARLRARPYPLHWLTLFSPDSA